ARKVENLVREQLEWLAMQVLKTKEWLDAGGIVDIDTDRMRGDYFRAKEQSNKIVKGPLDEALRRLTKDQAHVFWLFRGAIENNDEERIKNDYHDSERYIGFLIAERLVERCMTKKLRAEDAFYLKNDHCKYLQNLSLEEYIKIKAYFYWHYRGRIVDDNATRIKADDHDAFVYVHNTMWNCRERSPKACPSRESMQLINGYLLDLCKEEQLAKIKDMKISTAKRLNLDIREHDVEKFVGAFYQQWLQKALKGDIIIKEHIVQDLLDCFYACSCIPNMLEFVLRCFLCTHIQTEAHNEIRKTYQLPFLQA
ncbi:MAG: hypothetical protein D4R73_04035, partial [Deltaproteobacteria bacterium]